MILLMQVVLEQAGLKGHVVDWQFREGPDSNIATTITSPSGHRSEGIFWEFWRIFARKLAENGWKWVI